MKNGSSYSVDPILEHSRGEPELWVRLLRLFYFSFFNSIFKLKLTFFISSEKKDNENPLTKKSISKR